MVSRDDLNPLGLGSKLTRPDHVRSVAQEAFLFGAPLLFCQLQADYLAQVTEPTGLRAPRNQFAHAREFVDASDRTVVGFNVDNLYSFAVLDLSEEPVVMTVPEMGDRYWVMQLIDGWNGVPAAPGSRTRGGRGGTFLISGPGQDVDVPDGMEHLPCPTRIAMIGGRTYCSGPEDYDAVRALQDQYTLTPLSRWGGGYVPPSTVPLTEGVDGETLVADQFKALSAEQFYNTLMELLADNPPYPADGPILERLESIGMTPGNKIEWLSLGAGGPAAVKLGYKLGQAEMVKAMKSLGDSVDGWSRLLPLWWPARRLDRS